MAALSRSLVCLALCALTSPALAQIPQAAPTEGLHTKNPLVHALINVRIVVSPERTIPKGVLVIRNGVIVGVGENLPVPADARIWDLSGRTIYPGFINSYAYLDLPKEWQPKVERSSFEMGAAPEKKTPTPGAAAWNERITPQRSASAVLKVDAKQTEKLRNLGFTVALVTPGRGIFRGTSTLINLSGTDENRSILRPQVAQHIAFEQSGFREDSYPGSLMGSIALIRQTLLDADWYSKAQAVSSREPQMTRPETNDALKALEPVVEGKEPVVFEAGDELDLLRALRIAKEFKLTSWLRGNGYEYRVLDQLKASRSTIIVPLDFPGVPEVETPEKALDIDLEALQHWNFAPSNLARLAKANIPFALTTDKLAKPEDTFWPRLRQAIKRGLSPSDALEALTIAPAKLFGVSGRYGTLESGKVANIVVADGDLFTTKAKIVDIWVDGQEYPTGKTDDADLRGTWTLRWTSSKGPDILSITGDAEKPKATLASVDATAAINNDDIVLLVPAKAFGQTTGIVRLSGHKTNEILSGSAQLPDGQILDWTGTRTAPFAASPETVPSETPLSEVETYPAGAFGMAKSPIQPEWLLVKNATIWTSSAQGILQKADLLVHQGKIAGVGVNLSVPSGAVVIDGSGKQVTPGLIDCHSHTAISNGVNEATHAVTAEVRVGDVVDATDIGIYRELGGGLTIANLLHGSANAIGGQNQVIKLRWGEDPEGLKFSEAPQGIKFALGENPKQSNWADSSAKRYPKSRMGVEQLIKDAFVAARDYESNWEKYRKGQIAMPPRRDLQLEAMAEILQSKRLVHAHSYRQDEVLMLLRVAQAQGFRVATFQHILEGYKVANAIAKAGSGGSSFSDWWGYKYEVVDAIPYNGALMSATGVNTSFNSDSDELARRLNTEAAKAVKYGGMSESEALKLVTLNPAKQLGIDKYVGSLEVGKDADFVIWNGSPLSTYSRPEQTWIDGRAYFDRQRDQQLRVQANTEREALIQKALPERQKALGGKPAEKSPSKPVDPRSFVYVQEYHSLYHNGGSSHAYSGHGDE
ncbi:MAG: amidohydrolase family protein [Anaerolineae bacterium]|nr:amidohydrolase family protein [Gloeobacterales cyanobacterium ES-bin-313]